MLFNERVKMKTVGIWVVMLLCFSCDNRHEQIRQEMEQVAESSGGCCFEIEE